MPIFSRVILASWSRRCWAASLIPHREISKTIPTTEPVQLSGVFPLAAHVLPASPNRPPVQHCPKRCLLTNPKSIAEIFATPQLYRSSRRAALIRLLALQQTAGVHALYVCRQSTLLRHTRQLLSSLSGFRDVEKWRGHATASLGGKTDQQWLHPCLVSKLTAPAPSTLIPSEPVNRFLRAPLTMAAPLFLLQMEAPEMAPAWWLRWLGGSTSLLRTFRAPRRNPCCSPVGGSDVSVCGLHFTKPRNHTCCVVQESELTFEPRTLVACVLPSSHCIFFALSGLGDPDILGTVPQCPEDDWKCCSMSAEGGCEVESDGG